MSAPSCPGCGADLRSFETHSRYCYVEHPSAPAGASPVAEGVTASAPKTSSSVSLETPGDESPIFAFQVWVARYVVAFGRLLTQDEYALAQSAFFAAHPGQGPTSALMGAPGGTGDRGEQFVKCVASRELEPRILMLCPFAAGVSVEEYDGMPDVPDRWACTCGAEHGFSVDDCEIQFRRPVPPGASVEPETNAKTPVRCADCGIVLNAGEAKCFTVCTPCWDKVYPKVEPPAALSGPLTALVERWEHEIEGSDPMAAHIIAIQERIDDLRAALALGVPVRPETATPTKE